jgi:hypothetical protein
VPGLLALPIFLVILENHREFPDEEPKRHSSPDEFGEAAMKYVPQNQAVLGEQQATVNRTTIVVPGECGK